ncbi:helix-turn-helix domain-containing protein [Hymenobacter terrenus]|uniref:helix-turn-helix domain-containing protein n=1 Tax=Hymenobacter terrenus TaxID=1629124 RepID=UPI000619E0A4|nr:helix-turn-helix transcriptional regulator [Hymenobacter terrenus]
MSRRAVPSTSLVARVRAWFGLRQEQLALYLGVSPALVRALETGRRSLTADVLQALLPLVAHLPAAPPVPEVEAAPLPPGTLAPDAGALDFRRRVCLQQAARLRAQAAQLAQQARRAERWAQALPALLGAPDSPNIAADNATARAAWRADWLHRQARPLPAEATTRWHLLRARVIALEAEAAALALALPG